MDVKYGEIRNGKRLKNWIFLPVNFLLELKAQRRTMVSMQS